MLTRDPFDIAPAARRPTRAAWLLFALSILFAAFAASMLQRGLVALHGAKEGARSRELAQRAQAQVDTAARERANDPASREKLRAQQELQRKLRLSWSSLFDALEHAARKVEGRVTIASLTPAKNEAGGAEVGITGLALSNDVLLEYVEALQQEPHVRDAVLTSQQLAQSGTTPVARFRISLVWEPLP